MSLRREIVFAMREALARVLPDKVVYCRREQIGDLPALVIRIEAEENNPEVIGVHDATLTFAVDCYVRYDGADGDGFDLIDAIDQSLRADPTLGLGSNVQITPARRSVWDYDGFDDIRITTLYEVQYRDV